MVIDDLNDFRLFNIVHRLVHFIMVHKDHFLPVHIQKITSGYGSHTFSSLIDHRKGTVAVFDHYLLDIVREVFRMESYQILGFHYEFNRDTLIDQSGNGKRIHGGRDNDDTLLMGKFDYFFCNLYIHSHDNAADVQFNGLEMILLPVSQDDHIIFFHIIFQHIRIRGSNHHLAFREISVLISLHYFAV